MTTIKPLVWRETKFPRIEGLQAAATELEAKTSLGTFKIEWKIYPTEQDFIVVRRPWIPFFVYNTGKYSVDEIKSIVEDEYVSRVQECLE